MLYIAKNIVYASCSCLSFLNDMGLVLRIEYHVCCVADGFYAHQHCSQCSYIQFLLRWLRFSLAQTSAETLSMREENDLRIYHKKWSVFGFCAVWDVFILCINEYKRRQTRAWISEGLEPHRVSLAQSALFSELDQYRLYMEGMI